MATRLGLDALLPRSLADVHARMVAGLTHGLHGHLAWVARQIIPDTADGDFLERWAGLFSVFRKAAVGAEGPADFTGTDATVIPAATLVRRSDGTEYETLEEATIASGTAQVSVRATVAGATSNAAAGTKLALVSPISGIDAEATVAAGGLVGGADIEDDVALRGRLITRMQGPPQGGAADDYEQWALEVAGVTRAWPLANHLGLGTVGLTFVLDEDPVTIIPNAEKLAEVDDLVQGRRPVTAAVTVFAPTTVAMAVDLTLVPASSNTQNVQDAVKESLEDMLAVEAKPGGTITIAKVREAISTADGEVDHVLNSPSADVTSAAGELIVLGTVTFS